MKKFWFDVVEKNGGIRTIGIAVRNNFVIGFAGRNTEKIMEHIHELAEIGVPAPKNIPSLYTCSTSMLTQEPVIGDMGRESSGEVEFIIIRHQGQVFVGIGSDHTDRGMESYSVPKSKGVCEKPIGRTLWKYEDVKDHWDELEMRSWQIMEEGGEEKLYQDGTAEAILPLEKLVASVAGQVADIEDSVIFSGTVPMVAGLAYGKHFRAEIYDRKLNRKLELVYGIEILLNE